MKKFKLNSLTSIVITMAIMLSCGGYLIADDIEQPEVVEEPVIEQVEEEEPEVVEVTEPVTEPSEDEEIVDEETVDEGEAEEPEEVYETISVEEIISVDSEFDDDYLAEQFIAQEMSVGPQACYSSNYDYVSTLSEHDQTIFNYLVPQISAIAHGNQQDTIIIVPESTISFTYTAAELGVDEITRENINSLMPIIADKVPVNSYAICDALLNTCPYDMYWVNKVAEDEETGGMRFYYGLGYTSSRVVVRNFTYKFSVASEYKTDSGDEYKMNCTFGQATEAAASNARSIIYRYSALDDYSKLLAYNNAICSLVDYNDGAANPPEGTTVPYGNPWQMIWVFDGDDSTMVVCEGYSKAFQFLCDNSVFQSSNVYAISVSGVAVFTNNQGNHMWNVVHMSDGNNYLVDVTNNDKPAPYANKLFMIGYATGSVNDGYNVRYNNYRYVYDRDTKTDYPAGVLTLSNTDYTPSSSELTSLPAFSGHAMQLSGTIGLQFFVELPENADPDDYYVTFTNQHGHISESEEFRLVSSDKIDSPDTYMVQINLSSIQMAEEFVPTLHNADDTWTGSAYSAQNYIDWGLANVDPASSDYRIILTLADYGHYSQPYLSEVNHWDDYGSVYSQMTTYRTSSYDYEDVSAAASESSIVVNDLSGTGFTKVTYSLRFGDTISLRVFLEASDILTIDNSLFTFTGATPVIGRDGNRVTITFNDIPATALTNIFTISYAGKTLVGRVSPMSYVYGMLNTTGTSDAGRDLVCALYYYAQACGPTLNI